MSLRSPSEQLGDLRDDARLLFDESPTRLLFAAVLHKPAAPHAVLATVQRVAGLSGFGGTHGR